MPKRETSARVNSAKSNGGKFVKGDPRTKVALKGHAAARAKDPDGLLPDERTFALEYLLDRSPSAAAERAGFAASTGSDLMQREPVQKYIRKELNAQAQRLRERNDKVIEELLLLVHSDVTHYRMSSNGTIGVVTGVPKKATRAVSSFKRRTKRYQDENGNDVETEEQEIRLWDKNTAIRTFMQHAGLLNENVRIGGPNGEPLPAQHALTLEQLRAMASSAKDAARDE